MYIIHIYVYTYIYILLIIVVIRSNSLHFSPTNAGQGSWSDTLSSWGGLESSLMKITCKSNERRVFPGTIRQQLLFWPGSSVDKRKLLPLRSRKSAFQVLSCLKSVGGQGSAWLPLSAERSWHGMISYIRESKRRGHSVLSELWWSGKNKNNWNKTCPH